MLYVYALLLEEPRRSTRGLAGEPIRLVRASGIVAACGEVASAPAPAPDALRAHDLAVRRLWDEVDALLPARFGEVARDEADLSRLIEPRRRELEDALRLVAGSEQMVLRVFGRLERDAGPVPRGEEAPPALGPGARHLARLSDARDRERLAPELDPLRPVLLPLVRAERIERARAAGLVLSAYHLVPRGEGRRYAEAVHAASPPPGARYRASGPFPPYAFAAEVKQ